MIKPEQDLTAGDMRETDLATPDSKQEECDHFGSMMLEFDFMGSTDFGIEGSIGYDIPDNVSRIA